MKIQKLFPMAWIALLLSVSAVGVAQPAVSVLPQPKQPQISEQSKDLFRQRWAEDSARATSSVDGAAAHYRSETISATAKVSVSAANPPAENRTNQKAYVDQVMQSLQSNGR
jgi:hypothetical protein